MPDETLDLFEITRITRSMRRLKPGPGARWIDSQKLEVGVAARSGGNTQRWRFLVVQDLEIKKTVGGDYNQMSEIGSLRRRPALAA